MTLSFYYRLVNCGSVISMVGGEICYLDLVCKLGACICIWLPVKSNKSRMNISFAAWICVFHELIVNCWWLVNMKMKMLSVFWLKFWKSTGYGSVFPGFILWLFSRGRPYFKEIPFQLTDDCFVKAHLQTKKGLLSNLGTYGLHISLFVLHLYFRIIHCHAIDLFF